MQGEIHDVPLFEQVCVLKEVDLHYKWAPFCSSSLTIADLGKLDTVGWFMIGLAGFGIARDGCFRAIGCDNIAEDGSILLTGQGLQDRMPNDTSPVGDPFLTDDPIIDKLDIPPIPSRRGSGRMTIRKFEAVIHVTSPTSARTRLVANIDPNLSFMPQSLLEFIMKHVAGMVLAKLQAAAKRIPKNPVTNAHAVKMREERQFYQGWLMKKFQHICDSNGWEMPAVGAFNLTKDQLKKKGGKSAVRMATFGPDHTTSALKDSTNGQLSDSTGDGTMSELTSSSTRSWMSNPIGSYLREIEEKTKRRKEEEVQASRQKAVDRLKPRDLSLDKKERLNQLKQAKAQRRMTENQDVIASPNSVVKLQQLSFSQNITNWLHGHGSLSRFFFVTVLVVSLFTMLHPDELLRFSPVSFDPEGDWRILLLEDAWAVVYMGLCGIAHFSLCDVALVYAFDSLELGSKAGHQAKKFYSDNVRLGVAFLSMGIVGFSVLKAAIKVWVRAGLWYSLQLGVFLKGTFWPDDLFAVMSSLIPEQVSNTLNVFLAAVYEGINYVANAVAYVSGGSAEMALDGFVRSHSAGRIFLSVGGSCVDFIKEVWNDTTTCVYATLQGFEGKVSIVSWRTEAFATAKMLFSYTAVFLLTALVLFNLSAKNRRYTKKPPKTSEDAITLEPGRTPALDTAMSSLSDYNDLSNRLTNRHVHVSIPENEVIFHDAIGVAESFVPDEAVSLASTMKRKARFRFRRSKTEVSGSGATSAKSGGSVDRPRFRKTQSA